MLIAELIEPALQSAWASPVILVKKNNSPGKRIVNDYSEVNACTFTLSFTSSRSHKGNALRKLTFYHFVFDEGLLAN